jgi:hypothetical protein
MEVEKLECRPCRSNVGAPVRFASYSTTAPHATLLPRGKKQVSGSARRSGGGAAATAAADASASATDSASASASEGRRG